MKLRIAIALLILAASSVSNAEPATPKPIFGDRASDASYLDLGSGFTRQYSKRMAYVFRNELYAQWLSRFGAGAYASVPVVLAKHDGVGEHADAESRVVPHAEVGGLYSLALNSRWTTAFRVGGVHSTLSPRLASGDASTFASLVRPPDVALLERETNWLRLGVSSMAWLGDTFVRLDVGYDMPYDQRTHPTAPTMARFGGAIGWHGAKSTTFLLEASAMLLISNARTWRAATLGVSGELPISKRVALFGGAVLFHVYGVGALIGVRTSFGER